MQTERLERRLEVWTEAGLIDRETATRILVYESDRDTKSGARLSLSSRIVFALGAVMLAAGVLLFVAAHWDDLSPAQRFSLVLTKIAVLHIAGMLTAARWPMISKALHLVGTVAFGAGIFLAGQIFNLQEHWPGGVLLWAIGASVAYIFFRDTAHAVLCSVLIPFWLCGEWLERLKYKSSGPVVAFFILLVAIVYFTAPGKANNHGVRRALKWVGGIPLIPAAISALYLGRFTDEYFKEGTAVLALAWVISVVAPLALSYYLIRKDVWITALYAVWSYVLLYVQPSWRIEGYDSFARFAFYAVGPFLWCAAGSVGFIAWGMRDERPERVNLGIAGFALSVLMFYFSSLMDKLGRSWSLIGFGVLFLVGGWILERTRRRLIAKLEHRDGSQHLQGGLA